ncbi:DUF6713 family protein [Paenibacillus rhizoplanae]
MDAIRAKEWRMFIFLRELTDERAFKVFTILHLPLYAFFLLFSLISQHLLSFIIIDMFF